MRRIRVIPVLLIRNGGLVKTTKFKDPAYVGDPINAVKIFNEKEVDEIVVLDISATAENRGPDLKRIRTIAEEAFMPFAYGGGIRTVEDAQAVLGGGVEKVVINTAAVRNPNLVTEIASRFGSQSVVVSIDVHKPFFGGNKVYANSGKTSSGIDPVQFAKQMEDAGAGELLLNHIDREGTGTGYDLELIRSISAAVQVPVVACGGARNVADFKAAVSHGASAVAAGSIFVFHGPHRAVLIQFPTQEQLVKELYAAG